MRIVIIDNYDSFTYNLSHIVKELGCEVSVVRNDEFEMESLSAFDKIILSPGPGIPSEAGQLLEAIRRYAGHGVASTASIVAPDYLFEGLPEKIEVGRYHSWVVDGDSLPECLEVTSVSEEGQVMSLRHKELDIRGLQFHPESVLTPEGKAMLRNWVDYRL